MKICFLLIVIVPCLCFYQFFIELDYFCYYSFSYYYYCLRISNRYHLMCHMQIFSRYFLHYGCQIKQSCQICAWNWKVKRHHYLDYPLSDAINTCFWHLQVCVNLKGVCICMCSIYDKCNVHLNYYICMIEKFTRISFYAILRRNRVLSVSYT